MRIGLILVAFDETQTSEGEAMVGLTFLAHPAVISAQMTTRELAEDSSALVPVIAEFERQAARMAERS